MRGARQPEPGPEPSSEPVDIGGGSIVAAPKLSCGTTYRSPFALYDRVILLGDESLLMVVSGVLWRRNNPQIEVTWVHNGNVLSSWLSPDLLTTAPEHLCARQLRR